MGEGAQFAQSHADDCLESEEMFASDEEIKQEVEKFAECTSNHMKQEDKAIHSVSHDISSGDDHTKLMSWLEARLASDPIPQGMTKDTHKVNVLESIVEEIRYHMKDSTEQAEHQRTELEQLNRAREKSVAALKVQSANTERLRLKRLEAEKQWKAEKQHKLQTEEEASKALEQLRRAQARSATAMKEQFSWEDKFNAVEKQLKLAKLMRQVMEGSTDSERRKAIEEYGKMAMDDAGSNMTGRCARPSYTTPKATKFPESRKKGCASKPAELKGETTDSEAEDFSTSSKSTSRPAHPKRTVRSLNSDDEALPQQASKKLETEHDRNRGHSSSTRSFSSSTHRTTPAADSTSGDEAVEANFSDEEGGEDATEVKPCKKYLNGESCACEGCWDRSDIRSKRR